MRRIRSQGAGGEGFVSVDVAGCGARDGSGPGREFAGLREAWRNLVEAAWVRRDAVDGAGYFLQASGRPVGGPGRATCVYVLAWIGWGGRGGGGSVSQRAL